MDLKVLLKILFLLFFVRPFIFFLLAFCFFYSYDFSWGGFISLDSHYLGYLLFYLALITYFFICVEDFFYVLKFLIYFLFFFSFYIFFSTGYFFLFLILELVVVPLLILLLGYGSQVQKVHSSLYIVFYSSFSSLPMLWAYLSCRFNFDFPLDGFFLSPFILLFFLLGFLMKFPVYYFHFWLPLVHVEAPTPVRMYLARILLKLGVFGFLVFLFCYNCLSVFFFLFWSFFGIFFALFMCVSSGDTKVVAAYSSIIHMSFLFFILSYFGGFSYLSVLFIVLGHGYVSYLWFLYIGKVYSLLGTRLIYITLGFLSSNLLFFVLFSSIIIFNAGVPVSYSFTSEILGASQIFFTTSFFLFIFFVYYFGSFYYSISLILSVYSGLSLMGLNYTWLNFVFLFYLSNFNFLLV